jgi:hypothetical protein
VRRRRAAGGFLVGYAVATGLDLLAELTGLRALAALLPIILMPLLAGYLVSAVPRTRMVAWVVGALGFSWLGDTLGFALLFKIAFFLGAQVCYAVAFWPLRRRSLFGNRATSIGWVVGFGGLVLFVSAHAGAVGPPVAIYGASLGLMIGLATGVHRLTAIGAVLFLVSDLALAWQFFFDRSAGRVNDFLVMATYLPAQLLIIAGVTARARAPVRPR